MRHIPLAFVFILFCSFLLAAEADAPPPPGPPPPAHPPPLPAPFPHAPAARPILAKHDQELELAKKQYEQRVAAAATACITSLRKVQETETKKGNLDGAVEIKNKADELLAVVLEPQKVTEKRVEHWISKEATYKASSAEMAQKPFLLTGEGGSYSTEAGDEFAFHTRNGAGEHITIDLGITGTVTRIEIENRKDAAGWARAAGLTIWLSSAPDKKGDKVWTAKTVEGNWDATIAPTKARYVTIGLPENVKNFLHLNRVKVYGY